MSEPVYQSAEEALRESDLRLVLSVLYSDQRERLRKALRSGRLIHGAFMLEERPWLRCLVGESSGGVVQCRDTLLAWLTDRFGPEDVELTLRSVKRLIVGWDVGHEVTKGLEYDDYYPEPVYRVTSQDVLTILDELDSARPIERYLQELVAV